MATKQSKQWVIASVSGIDGLQLAQNPILKIGDDDVLVKFGSVSLNYRDLANLNVSTSTTNYKHSKDSFSQGGNPFPVSETLSPGLTGQAK
jgi:NADPH:quinone reductase-like Zn-dependent oxidoreductase